MLCAGILTSALKKNVMGINCGSPMNIMTSQTFYTTKTAADIHGTLISAVTSSSQMALTYSIYIKLRIQ
jgi:hypothetical protein